MTICGLFIFAFETRQIYLLFKKHFPEGSLGVSVEEFIWRAPLEDVIRLTIHQRIGFAGLCLATMGRLFNV